MQNQLIPMIVSKIKDRSLISNINRNVIIDDMQIDHQRDLEMNIEDEGKQIRDQSLIYI